MTGRLEAIWLKRFRRGPMDPVQAVELVAGRGLVGNANQGGRRQVTIIQQEIWDELMQKFGASLPPSTRRANPTLICSTEIGSLANGEWYDGNRSARALRV